MKKRILIPIVGQGSIIHIIRTGMLEKMRAFCEPVVILLWQQDDLIDELKAAGIEVHIMPKYNVSNSYKTLRSKVNYWYQHFRLKTPSTSIQNKYHFRYKKPKQVLKRKIRERVLWLKLMILPGYIARLINDENTILLNEGTYAEYKQWVTTLNATGIFTVTPFLHQVELVARIIKQAGGLLIASIHSFDNVTKRGWPAIFFDNYFVWNKYNKAELERINPAFITSANITIAGAPQFDFHYNPAFCWDKDVWLKKLGLPKNKKIILYSGGSANLLPNEPQYVKHIAQALENKILGDDVVILFRCHPLDNIQRWKDTIGESPFVYYDHKAPAKEKLDYNNFTVQDEIRLISTLKHTDVHVNLCSTMAVDGSIFNKPQIAPYYDDVNKPAEPFLRAIYNQEHYKPIMASGVLNLAHNRNELVGHIKNALAAPSKYNTNCPECVKEIATFNDGKSTERVTAKLKTFLN